ncbi:MAG: hypothetical protein GKS00_11700 [Alphaproteobacteria bacterium]|nr:hypothetical protein [Alphaproteobacteria bacterium]
MVKLLQIISASLLSIFILSFGANAAERTCIKFDVGSLKGIKVCNDDGVYATVGGKKLFQARHHSGSGGFYRAVLAKTGIRDKNLRINSQFTKLRLEVNSGGAYKNWLILEICGWDPTFIKWGQWGKNRCSQWHKLGKMQYIKPR